MLDLFWNICGFAFFAGFVLLCFRPEWLLAIFCILFADKDSIHGSNLCGQNPPEPDYDETCRKWRNQCR